MTYTATYPTLFVVQKQFFFHIGFSIDFPFNNTYA